MNRWIKWLVMIASVFLLSGCWDTRFLKDARLTTMLGMDHTPRGLRGTAVIREVSLKQGGAQPVKLTVQTWGNTPEELRERADLRVNKRFDPSKNRTLVIGEKLARKDIYPLLDLYYRDPRSALNAQIVVCKGKAEDFLKIGQVGDTLIGKFTDELIRSTEELTQTPMVNLQSICPLLFDPGKDFALPYLIAEGDGIDGKKSVSIGGVAMFHGHHMTGTLTPEETKLYLLLQGKKRETARLILPVAPEPTNISSHVTIDVKDAKKKMDVRVRRDDTIDIFLHLHLTAKVNEFPRDQLAKPETIQKLNRTLSRTLTEQSSRVLSKMKRARFDGFGVGREIMAHTPENWHGDQWWTKTYPKVRFHPRVEVEIVEHGIIY